jgi:hypothetical protein
MPQQIHADLCLIFPVLYSCRSNLLFRFFGTEIGKASVMTPKQESETLLNGVLPFAEKMLREHGEFYPYGGYIDNEGKIVYVGADDPDTDYPKSSDLIYVLRSSFREMVSSSKCRAVAIVFNVKVKLPVSNIESDAIQVCVDHIANYSAQVFFPYRISQGEVVYGETFAQEGKHDIF